MDTTDVVKVALNGSEYLQAMNVGIMRSAQDRKLNRQHTYGAQREDAEALDIRGAVGEALVAKHLNVFWLGTGVFRGDDVGEFQVRASRHKPPFLRLHPKDDDTRAYISVYVCEGAGEIYGWIDGKDGKQERYWSDRWNNGRPAYWVPCADLRPMSEIYLRRE